MKKKEILAQIGHLFHKIGIEGKAMESKCIGLV